MENQNYLNLIGRQDKELLGKGFNGIYSRKFLNFNSRINYSVKYMKDIAYSWNFNLKYFDSELLELLLPVIHPDGEFSFENINYSTAENIAELENLFSDYSIDLYAEIDKRKPILLYPEETTWQYNYRFSDVSLWFKIIEVMSNIFIKDKLLISIWKAIINDSDFISLLKCRWWKAITIENCLIKCTTEIINLSKIMQPWVLNSTKIETSNGSINGK